MFRQNSETDSDQYSDESQTSSFEENNECAARAEQKISNAQQERDIHAQFQQEHAASTTKRVYATFKRFNDWMPKESRPSDADFGRKNTQKKESVACQFRSRQNWKRELVRQELFFEGLRKNQPNAVKDLLRQDDEAYGYSVRKRK